MSDPLEMKLFQQLVGGKAWSVEQSRAFFSRLVRGEVDPFVLAGVVSTLKLRGETVPELTGAAEALLDSATPFDRPDHDFADVVGTGGDGHNTINLSTIAAFVAAACGCPIIKHGNRSITSCSGSFDLLEALGIPLDATPQESRQVFDRTGICFLFAPLYHPGMRHAVVVRKALKFRTIFNLLGPLVNPARPAKMLLGVADPVLLKPMAEVLIGLGCRSALVVHGSGVDEVAVHGDTQFVQVEGESITGYNLSPTDFGSRTFNLEELTCGDAAESHRRSLGVLEGRGSEAENSAVCLNVAMVLRLFGKAGLSENFSAAMDVLKSGKPAAMVRQLAVKSD